MEAACFPFARDTRLPRVREISPPKLLILWILIRLRGGTAWISADAETCGTRAPFTELIISELHALITKHRSLTSYRIWLHSILLWRTSRMYMLDFDWFKKNININKTYWCKRYYNNIFICVNISVNKPNVYKRI